MEITVTETQVVVDYDGTDYTFEFVDEEELAYTASGGEDATVPDDVVEALETEGYIVNS